MRVLFDVVHPAHVHFYRFMIKELVDRGDEILVVSRPKDVTTQLLDELAIPHRVVGSGPRSGWLGQGSELLSRVASIVSISRDFKPDVICTRNPSGAIASRFVPGAKGLFDTDDGKQAGPVYHLAHPFATMTTLPDCLPESTKRRHVGYPSYKSLAFTHPDRFTPDPTIRQELGVGDEPYFIVRTVALSAAHDHGEEGLPHAAARAIVELLQQRGRVFVSGEADLPQDFRELQFPGRKDRFHDALAFAELVVGDSVSVPIEAALLGTPGVFVSTFARRLQMLNELQDRFGLISQFKPTDWEMALAEIDRATSDLAKLRTRGLEGRSQLLETKVDLTSWYLDLISSFEQSTR